MSDVNGHTRLIISAITVPRTTGMGMDGMPEFAMGIIICPFLKDQVSDDAMLSMDGKSPDSDPRQSMNPVMNLAMTYPFPTPFTPSFMTTATS